MRDYTAVNEISRMLTTVGIYAKFFIICGLVLFIILAFLLAYFDVQKRRHQIYDDRRNGINLLEVGVMEFERQSRPPPNRQRGQQDKADEEAPLAETQSEETSNNEDQSSRVIIPIPPNAANSPRSAATAEEFYEAVDTLPVDVRQNDKLS